MITSLSYYGGTELYILYFVLSQLFCKLDKYPLLGFDWKRFLEFPHTLHNPLTFSAVTLANTRLVRASPTAIRAPAAGQTSPLIGCSPMAVAAPSRLNGERATTATSASGVWRGPTHCCWATNPVTDRSTWERVHSEDMERRMLSAQIYF